MQLDLWFMYRQMLKSRRFEEAVIQLWEEGKISGEMHMGMGEEAICAAVVTQLQNGDAMALDHRGTPPMLMRGLDPVLLLREFLGRPDGLCSGKGGHMHLFSPGHLALSSGIVGASGPAALGFALANQTLRPGSLAVAFFGEGAMNQGMLMESMNLASAWKLPVLFICKDNKWAITTLSASVTGGNPVDRARSFGIDACEVDGSDVEAIWLKASDAIEKLRNGEGPAFLYAQCIHLEGHFLGDPLLRVSRHPIKEARQRAGPLLKSVTKRKGAPMGERVRNLLTAGSLIRKALKDKRWKERDPLEQIQNRLKSDESRLKKVNDDVSGEIRQVVKDALIYT